MFLVLDFYYIFNILKKNHLMSKQKFVGEYPINASRKMLFPYMSTASGLSLWFADDVNINNINKPIIKEPIAAISAGIIDSQPYLDLNYEEDTRAQVDANFVICESGKIVEIQVTGEEHSFTKEQFQQIFNLSQIGISQIIKKQKEILNI